MSKLYLQTTTIEILAFRLSKYAVFSKVGHEELRRILMLTFTPFQYETKHSLEKIIGLEEECWHIYGGYLKNVIKDLNEFVGKTITITNLDYDFIYSVLLTNHLAKMIRNGKDTNDNTCGHVLYLYLKDKHVLVAPNYETASEILGDDVLTYEPTHNLEKIVGCGSINDGVTKVLPIINMAPKHVELAPEYKYEDLNYLNRVIKYSKAVRYHFPASVLTMVEGYDARFYTE